MSRKVVELEGEEIEQLYLWRKKQWKEALDAGDAEKATEHEQRAEEFRQMSEVQYKQAS